MAAEVEIWNFPSVLCSLHGINCRIYTEILTFAHIAGACCCFLYRSSSYWLHWYPSAHGARLKPECFFPWKINKGHSGGSLETADEKKHGSETRSSVDPAHLFKKACDRCITWATSGLDVGRYINTLLFFVSPFKGTQTHARLLLFSVSFFFLLSAWSMLKGRRD